MSLRTKKDSWRISVSLKLKELQNFFQKRTGASPLLEFLLVQNGLLGSTRARIVWRTQTCSPNDRIFKTEGTTEVFTWIRALELTFFKIFFGHLIPWVILNKKGSMHQVEFLKLRQLPRFLDIYLDTRTLENLTLSKMVLGKKIWGLLGLELSPELKNAVQMTVRVIFNKTKPKNVAAGKFPLAIWFLGSFWTKHILCTLLEFFKLTVLENLFPKRNIGAKFPFHHLIPWVLHNQTCYARTRHFGGKFHLWPFPWLYKPVFLDISPFSLI